MSNMRSKRGRHQYKSKNDKHVNTTNRRPEYRHYDQLSEKDVGITEYLGTLNGFTGVIKARYSDFQVNEIDLDGNMAKLTDTSVPKDFTFKMIKYNYNEVVESPNKNIPQETWEAIKAIINNHSTNTEPVTLDVENLDKESRSELHNCIKSHFGQKVIASTVSVEGKRQMQFKKFNKEAKNDARFQWPADKGEYVYFIVYKEKMDTLEATFKLSSSLNMGTSRFSHAGNKDRRSITSQWFCLKKVEPWKLINKTRNLYNIRIGNIKFKDVPLELGQLKGNRFRIALRNVNGSTEVINAAMNYLKENGFINYYGLQRFGNDKDVPTFQVGISLLQGKWKEAIDQILKPKLSDDPDSFHRDVVLAKKIYSETGDPGKAYDALEKTKSSSVEGKLLEGLKHSGEQDYVNALERVPRCMRLLYLHAFQSLIWNKMVSKRLQLYGIKPVVGDLVLLNTEGKFTEETDIDIKEENETEVKRKKQVKALTEEDLEKYSIYDVVLPLPGYDIVYPDNMRSFYKESVEECGLDLEMTKQKVKTYNLSGDYRRILETTENLTWSIVEYNKHTDNLILSDLQELKGQSEIQTTNGGQYKAVIMEFNLSACCYATMVLRQIMKIDTATNVQSKLNDYHTSEKTNHIHTSEKPNDDLSNSLLTNSEKYEQFKNAIFNTVGETPKRVNDSSDDVECPTKKQRLEESEVNADVSST